MLPSAAFNLILRELKNGPKTWGELVSSCKEENISKSAFHYQLGKLMNAKKVEEEKGSKKYKLLDTTLELANPREISFLLDVLEKPPSEEGYREGLADLEELCRHSRVVIEKVCTYLTQKVADKTSMQAR